MTTAPQREGTNLGVFMPKWLVKPRCEATNLGVFDLCKFGWVWSSLTKFSQVFGGSFSNLQLELVLLLVELL